MAGGFQRLITALQPHASGIRGEAGAAWGSNHRGSRELIRESVSAALPDLDNEQKNKLRKLGGRPLPAGWSLSISHTLELGGWMAVPLPAHIGYDVETASRVQMNLIRRVCSDAEITEAPQPAFLWAAKEACYKSLPPESQPDTFTALAITGWQESVPGLFVFRASVPGHGWVVEDHGLIHAAFLT